MRGGKKQQLMTLLREVKQIGTSRHDMKKEFGGTSPFIHSAGTLDKAFQRLRPLVRWLWAKGINDLELLNSGLVEEYLEERLDYHQSVQNCRQTFKVELSALATLEFALDMFALTHREGNGRYDFTKERRKASKRAKVLPQRSPDKEDRTIREACRVIESMENPKHRLMGVLQWEAGCRAEGVGAPRRGTNPFTAANFDDPETGEELDLIPDPVTQKIVAPLWTIEKGGKLAFKFCSVETKRMLLSYLHTSGALEGSYQEYLNDVNQALTKTGQSRKGVGTHGFRFAFARRRYKECLKNSYSDESAKLLVAQEMSHNRADITECYL